MNILQTLHPPDKDYGHMKIDEPKTPYSYETTDGEQLGDHEPLALDEDTLAAKIAKKAMECPKVLRSSSEEDNEEESDDENLTEEEKKKKREFEVKRKMHYNEFQAVKLARKLLEEEGEDEEEEEDEETETQTPGQSNCANEDSQRNGGQSSTDRIDIEDQNR